MWTILSVGQHVVSVAILWPRLVALTALASYTFFAPVVSAQAVFACLQVAWYVAACLSSFQFGRAKLATLQPALTRLEDFLKQPEIARQEVCQDNSGCQLRIQGSFSFRNSGEPALRNLDVSLPPGVAHVVVVGAPGSGKSAFLRAALGEMHPLGGAELMRASDAVAYYQQELWLFSGSIRENVLFGEAYAPDRYMAVLQAAGLPADLKLLPGGDMFDVGPAGSALSASQRAKVSVARVAYGQEKLVLFDNVLAGLDEQTGAATLESLLAGPFFQDRTCFVTARPHDMSFDRFHHMIFLVDGRVVEQGPPSAVTHSEVFKKVAGASSCPKRTVESVAYGRSLSYSGSVDVPSQHKTMVISPIEEQVSISSFGLFLKIAGSLRFFSFVVLALGSQFLILLMDISLAQWANGLTEQGVSGLTTLFNYTWLRSYAIFWCASILLCVARNFAGTACSCHFLAAIHHQSVQSILQGSVPFGYGGRSPGHDMKHMLADIRQIDFNLWVKMASLTCLVFGVMCPMIYVHSVLPLHFTLLVLPIYGSMYVFVKCFFGALPGFQRLSREQSTCIHAAVADMHHGGMSVRAFGRGSHVIGSHSALVSSYASSWHMANVVGAQWLAIRLVSCLACVYSLVALIGTTTTSLMPEGTFGLALLFCVLAFQSSEVGISTCIGLQSEFVAVKSLQACTGQPAESVLSAVADQHHVAFGFEIERSIVGTLKIGTNDEGNILVLDKNGKILLQASEDRQRLTAQEGALCDLGAPGEQLARTAEQQCAIVSVDGAAASAQRMADAICSPGHHIVYVRGGWLPKGAQLNVTEFSVGYRHSSLACLRGVTLRCGPGEKLGIAGVEGSGKSTLLWALLRIVEPRMGKVELNGVDCSKVSVRTLRSVMGLVPQDPVLFQGSLHASFDPLGKHANENLYEALRSVGLEKFTYASASSQHMSQGERQLFAFARMVLLQPPLLLIDELAPGLGARALGSMQQALRSTFPSSSALVVSRRADWLSACNRVAMLSEGEVVEAGPPASVLQRHSARLAAPATS